MCFAKHVVLFMFLKVGKDSGLHFRFCFQFAHFWRTQTLMTPWSRRSLTCTRQTGPNTNQLPGFGPRNMQWVKTLYLHVRVLILVKLIHLSVVFTFPINKCRIALRIDLSKKMEMLWMFLYTYEHLKKSWMCYLSGLSCSFDFYGLYRTF